MIDDSPNPVDIRNPKSNLKDGTTMTITKRLLRLAVLAGTSLALLAMSVAPVAAGSRFP